MTAINLLPWRETIRKERQKNFLLATAVAIGVTLLIFGTVHLHIEGLISHQEARNAFLTAQIERVDKQIKEIDTIEKEKQRLLARMNVIQELQQGRSQMVHVFDELVRVLPEGVYLTGLKQTDKTLELQGLAQSNARVSTYMRNLESSEWFKDPKLNVIEAEKANSVGNRNSKFTLVTSVVNPSQPDTEEAPNGADSKKVDSKKAGPKNAIKTENKSK